MDSVIPVGQGLPSWVDTSVYLSADETRELPDADCGDAAVCSRCFGRPMWTEKAHVARKQMGGRKKAGPTVRLCQACHTEIDQHPETMTMAVGRRDHAIVLLTRDGTEQVIGRVP